jgi:uncharacterized protein YidB (DUF937 family)
MSISAIEFSAASATQATRHPGQSAFKAVETLLGMQPDEIRSALDSGKTLVDLAADKGVSKDDLIKTIATAIKADRPGITDDRATDMATRIATRTPPTSAANAAGAPGGVDGPPPPPPPDGDSDDTTSTSSTGSVKGKHHHHHHAKDNVLSAVSQTLGMQTSDLVSALQGGSSLSDIASSKGVTEDALLAAIETALKGGTADSSGTYGSSTSSTSGAGTLVNVVA